MSYDYSASLNPNKALIFRIVHKDNIPWILKNGLHCGNDVNQSPHWVHIGNPELIEKRARHPVPAGVGGVLNDYVPFYFTPFSPMMANIHSGRSVKQHPNAEIVILVSNLYRVRQLNLNYIFSNSHAYYNWANFYTDLKDLDKIDWKILQARDFKRDPNDPAKFERYQAEALVHRHCPVSALEGIVCYTDSVKSQIETWLIQHNIQLPVHARSGWYFS
ncbi:MAG TPA: DUF4433 domain-containing protein [Cellvibrio sp.]|nr:DUF4433 domain-containing protein [Cellvibrio sp.]